jgi:hypothetical protein
MSPDQIDLEIEQLKQQLQIQKELETPIEERIETLQKKNWENYKNNLKQELIYDVQKLEKALKKEIPFKVVCKKYMSDDDFSKLISCFKLCSRSSNWRLLQVIYSDKNVTIENDLVSVLSTIYRRNILNKKDIYLTNLQKETYQQILSDFQQTEIFN